MECLDPGTAVIRRHLLTPADNRRLAHLCGPVDTHLRRIEAAMDVKLSRREGAMRIEGPRDAAGEVQTTLGIAANQGGQLQDIIQRGGQRAAAINQQGTDCEHTQGVEIAWG